jgi:hypothetical protein
VGTREDFRSLLLEDPCVDDGISGCYCCLSAIHSLRLERVVADEGLEIESVGWDPSILFLG